MKQRKSGKKSTPIARQHETIVSTKHFQYLCEKSKIVKVSPISSRASSQSFALISFSVFRDDKLWVLGKIGTICLQTIWKQKVVTDDAHFMIAQIRMQNFVWLSAD